MKRKSLFLYFTWWGLCKGPEMQNIWLTYTNVVFSDHEISQNNLHRCAYVYRWLKSRTSLLSVDWDKNCTLRTRNVTNSSMSQKDIIQKKYHIPRAFNQSTQCTAWASSFYQRFGKCRDDANRLCYRYDMVLPHQCVQRLKPENIRSLHHWSDKWNIRLRRAAGQGS